MSRAYRRWKEIQKAKKKFNKPIIYAYRKIYDWVEIQRMPTSMRAYRKDKHAKEIQEKRIRKYGNPIGGFILQMVCDPYQVSEQGRNRQANEHGRQR